jgi:hypothetical protein
LCKLSCHNCKNKLPNPLDPYNGSEQEFLSNYGIICYSVNSINQSHEPSQIVPWRNSLMTNTWPSMNNNSYHTGRVLPRIRTFFPTIRGKQTQTSHCVTNFSHDAVLAGRSDQAKFLHKTLDKKILILFYQQCQKASPASKSNHLALPAASN